MEHQITIDPLLSKIRTTGERDKLETELDVLLSNLFEHKGQGFEIALRTQVRSWVAAEIQNGLPDSVDAIQGYLTSWQDKLSKLKTLKLKIAFEPTDSSIDKFLDFTRKNIANDVILNIEVDPAIYGGAEITYEGQYRDYSLKRLFNEEYRAQEEELKKILGKVTSN